MISRRRFLGLSACAAAGVRAAWALAPSSGVQVTAEVASGVLRGEAHDGFQVFRGVPFAQPPVGDLRFRRPEPVASWTGVRDATHFAAAPIQPGNKVVAQSEDCLYLNIWAPKKPLREPGKNAEAAAGLPVFVWIHGGGFTGGYAFDPLANGERFARDGIVCITVAYRLGSLGFLDVSPLLGPTYAGSAGNALRDLITALQWIQQNVHAFGGDPRRVTIGGESAGAKLADLLMGIPAAQSLFHQVISESGGAERIWPSARGQEIGRAFGQVWTEQTTMAGDALRTASAEQLVDVQERFQRTFPVHFPFRPELDGKLVPQSPLAAIRNGSSRGKRLLIGTNRDESALFLGPSPQKAPGAADLGNLTSTQFTPIAAHYTDLYPQMSEELRRIRSVTAEEYLVPSTRVAETHVDAGGEAYVYRLDFPGTGRFAGLAFHSYDLRFVWDNLGATAGASERKLADQMHAAWASFIHGKPPSGPGLPRWPQYALSSRSTMLFDAVSRVVPAPDAAELALWNGLLMN